MIRTSLLSAVSAAAIATGAAAQNSDPQEFQATLEEHAQLPAQSFVAPPADAPDMFSVSGRFTGDAGRVEDLYSIYDPATGLARPFPGQPLQGFSGIRSLGDERFLVLTDNGFGAMANSADAMLMFNVLEAEWDTGRMTIDRTVFLSDPNRVVPFPIVNEASESRYLTGADFDLESIQPVDDGYWIGDEFGPWLIEVDEEGVVQQVVATEPAGDLVRSPDNPFVSAPNPGAELAGVSAMRSGGYEGMAISDGGRTLYPLLEKPMWVEEGSETVSGRPVLRMFEFDTETAEWADRIRYYPLEDSGHAIGDFNLIDGTRGLIIERDSGQGGAWSENPAEFKRIYLVDLERADKNGVLEKIAYIDLMNIEDSRGVAPRGTENGIFNFPFVTIEDVDRVDEDTIVVANDNNFPFSVGREQGRADDNEFILLKVSEFLNAE